MPALLTRRYCADEDPDTGYCYDYYGNSDWYNYGRWILLAAIIVFLIFVYFMFACLSSRRRRRLGQTPYRGTGWATGVTPAGHAPAQYTGGPAQYPNGQQQQPYSNNQYQSNGAAPPAYHVPENQGYFGGQQQTGVELQQPQGAYVRGGENVYNPPVGPPPGKKEGDGIVR